MHLLKCSDPSHHLIQAIAVKCHHTLTYRGISQLRGRRIRKDHLSNFRVDHHQLKDTQSPLVSRFLAMITALTPNKIGVFSLLERQTRLQNHALTRRHLRLTLTANGSHKTLSQNSNHATGDQITRYTHVHHPRHSTGRIVRMKRTENQVSS